MDTITTASPLDVAITNSIKDDANLLSRLSDMKDTDLEYISIESELPAYPDADIIIGYIQRWREVQRLFGKDLRIFAWSYNTTVEKYVLGCVQNMSNIYITVLPAELRRKEIVHA